MADTRRSLSALQTVLADNTVGAISPQDVRDVLVSAAPPYGAMYISSSAATSLSADNTWTKVSGTTTSTNLKEFTMPANNRLTYGGVAPVHCHVVASISMTAGANNQVFGFRIVKNGDETLTDSVASELRRKVGTGTDVGSLAVHYDSAMTTGDYLELWVENETSAAEPTITQFYFFVMGMLM